jgi:hypothetical protein
MSIFKLMRVVALLSILFVLVAGTWMTERRMASWQRPVWVTIYPIAADDNAETLKYVERLNVGSFEAVNEFVKREALPYGVSVTPPFYFQLAKVSTQPPPIIPDQFSPAQIAWWSLKMRWWAWRKGHEDDLVEPDVQMFLLFHGAAETTEVEISVGIRKGRFGVVNAFAMDSMSSRNLVVFAHELMHVLGASDKYVQSSGEPEYPFGFANPNLRPLFPQKYAEIMGGRIPLTSGNSKMPESLELCKIGRRTAEEIGFYNQLLD